MCSINDFNKSLRNKIISCRNITLTMEPDLNFSQQVTIGSFLFYKNDLVTIGVNKKKTDPLQKRFAARPQALYIHSEINAIKKAVKVLDEYQMQKSYMIVTRFKKVKTKTGHDIVSGLAKPCYGCQAALEAFGIKKVYYTTDDYEEIGIL